MSSDESNQRLAGHPPAVKAGGMRITQHKTGREDKTGKDAVVEDVTGLAGPNPLPSGPVNVSGVTSKGHADYTPEAAQVAHSPKPPAAHNVKPHPNIHQPRK